MSVVELKSHGRNNRIEGVVKEGMKVVVVEDLISTGGSSLECVEEKQKSFRINCNLYIWFR